MEEVDEPTPDFSFSLTSLAAAQGALERAGITPKQLREELDSPDLLAYTLEDMVETLGEAQGLEAASELIAMFLGEMERVQAVNETAGDIEEDDYDVREV